jgi:predicted SnoaL-like aldol condensation-catalyzing enzyme
MNIGRLFVCHHVCLCLLCFHSVPINDSHFSALHLHLRASVTALNVPALVVGRVTRHPSQHAQLVVVENSPATPTLAGGALHTATSRGVVMANSQRNKQLVGEFCELFYNQKKFEEAGALLDEQVVNRHPGAVGRGRQGMIDNFSRDVKSKFPSIHIKLTRIIAEGDFVWTHGLITGLPNNGELLSVDIWKVVNGKLAEHWDVQQPLKPGEDVTELL